jgi:hypothetical protein
MASHLLKSGYPVTIHDPREEAIEAVLEFGGERGASPADVAARSEIVVSSLPNPAIVEAVALGEGGIIHGAKPGSVYIDMSSIEPNTTRRGGVPASRPRARSRPRRRRPERHHQGAGGVHRSAGPGPPRKRRRLTGRG